MYSTYSMSHIHIHSRGLLDVDVVATSIDDFGMTISFPECCSVHRSLGRHVSHIKSLHSGSLWIPEQLAMVQSLFAAGANSVWEYSLLNPGSHSSSHHSSSNSASKVSRYISYLLGCPERKKKPLSYFHKGDVT